MPHINTPQRYYLPFMEKSEFNVKGFCPGQPRAKMQSYRFEIQVHAKRSLNSMAQGCHNILRHHFCPDRLIVLTSFECLIVRSGKSLAPSLVSHNIPLSHTSTSRPVSSWTVSLQTNSTSFYYIHISDH